MASEEMVTIALALPRRVRFLVPRLAWHREACERVARALSRERGVSRVTARPATGSVIVEADEGTLDAATLQARLVELARDENDEQGRPLADLGPHDYPGPTRVARAVVSAVSSINGDVRSTLDERADLGTLLPVVFAVAGLAEVGVTGEMPVPSWFNLLWWSLRSFMTFNLQAVEEVEHPSRDRETADAL
jgi:hypothetical protein